MRVLYVCTANICRSASGEQLLRAAVAADPLLSGIEVSSAGTRATAGAPGCSRAPALVGHAQDHRSRRLVPSLLAEADLVLTAAREHRAEAVTLDPGCRSRAFTIVQAGRIADWMRAQGVLEAGRRHRDGPPAPDDPHAQVPPLPSEVEQRWSWLVEEMDAARGFTAVADPTADPAPTRRWGRSRRSAQAEPTSHPDDIADPHLLGMQLHPQSHARLVEATASLVRLLHATAA